MTIVESLQAVIEMFDKVAALQSFLSDYAGSDLASDYALSVQRANETITAKLTRLGSELFDAVANFDGSPEQLEEIGSRVNDIRTGELRLLEQIDAIQRGITANMAGLREDLLGVINGPKNRFQLIGEAETALGGLATATTVEEVADLAQKFEAAIRAMSPEDQASFGRELVELVDLFQARADERLEGFKADALAAGESTRTMINDFLGRIGDPIDFITEYNRRQADTLDVIAETAVTKDDLAEQSEADRASMETVMSDGLVQIAREVSGIGPKVSGAIRSGMSGIQVYVNMPAANNSLVSE
jgi:hypothetical protein